MVCPKSRLWPGTSASGTARGTLLGTGVMMGCSGTGGTEMGALTDDARVTGMGFEIDDIPGNGVLHSDGLMLGGSVDSSVAGASDADSARGAAARLVDMGSEDDGTACSGRGAASTEGAGSGMVAEYDGAAAGWVAIGADCDDGAGAGVDIGVLHTDLGMVRSPDTSAGGSTGSFSRRVGSGAGHTDGVMGLGEVMSEVRMSGGNGISASSPGTTTPPEVRLPLAYSHSQTTHGQSAGWMWVLSLPHGTRVCSRCVNAPSHSTAVGRE